MIKFLKMKNKKSLVKRAEKNCSFFSFILMRPVTVKKIICSGSLDVVEPEEDDCQKIISRGDDHYQWLRTAHEMLNILSLKNLRI